MEDATWLANMWDKPYCVFLWLYFFSYGFVTDYRTYLCHGGGQTGTLGLVPKVTPAAQDSCWDLCDKNEVPQIMLCFQNGSKLAQFEP